MRNDRVRPNSPMKSATSDARSNDRVRGRSQDLPRSGAGGNREGHEIARKRRRETQARLTAVCVFAPWPVSQFLRRSKPGCRRSLALSPRRWRRRLRFSLASKQAAFGVAIILPTLAILAIFRFLPMGQALSLTAVPSRSSSEVRRAGELREPAAITRLFLKSARVSLTYVLFSVVPVLPLSLGLAVLFNRSVFSTSCAPPSSCLS